MSGFVKRTKSTNTANPAGGLNPAKTPNVGQYGWTSFDAGKVDQLIQYVEMCKEYARLTSDKAAYVNTVYEESKRFFVYIEDVYNELKPIIDKLEPIYQDIIIRHEDVVIRHENVIELQRIVLQDKIQIETMINEAAGDLELIRQGAIKDVTEIKDQAVVEVGKIRDQAVDETTKIKEQAAAEAVKAKEEADKSAASAVESAGYASDSQVSAIASEVSNKGSKSWYDKSYDLYLDLKEGQVYRGTWNPKTGAYPAHQGTNSVWDVVLDVGVFEVTFDSKKWRSGDRLIYVVAESKYDQISSGSGVTSVNGKTGAVDLKATDVKALPDDGAIRVERDSSNIYHTIVGGTDTANRGRTMIAAGEGGKKIYDNTSSSAESVHIGGDGSDGVYIYTNLQNNWGSHKTVKFLNGDIYAVDGTKRVYHQGYLPSLDVLGAAPAGYGLGEGVPPRVPNMACDDAVRPGFYGIYGSDTGTPYGTGPSGSRLIVTCWSSAHVTQMFFRVNSDAVWFRNKVAKGSEFVWQDWQQYYTTAYKPTAADVGALPTTGGTISGAVTLNNHLYLDGNGDIYLRGQGTNNPIIWFSDKEQNTNKIAIYHDRKGDQLAMNHYGTGSSDYSSLRLKHGEKAPVFSQTGGGTFFLYHEGYKPTYTAEDVGAIPITGGTFTGGVGVLNNSGLTVRETSGSYGSRFVTSSGYAYFQGGKTDGDVNDQKIAVSGWMGKLITDLRFLMADKVSPTVRWGSTNHKIYHEGYKPTITDIDTTGFDFLKETKINAPSGVVSGKYYPILVNFAVDRPELYISTHSAGADYSMNNCSFKGLVRSSGWTDQRSYATGQFSMYRENERSLHSIVGSSEGIGHYVVYVEARAFPVTIKTPVGTSVSCTGKDVVIGATTFKAAISGMTASADYGTKCSLLVDFNKGEGFYGNQLVSGDINVGRIRSKAVIAQDYNEQGAFITRRPGIVTYSMMGQSSSGDAHFGTGTTSNTLTSYVKVAPNKFVFSKDGNSESRIYHEGFKPTAADLNAVAVGDYGVGGKQGAAAEGHHYTEDKTPDFNKLITAGEYSISGNWANGINNKTEAETHTGIVKVEVRKFEAGPSYVQVYTGNLTNGLFRRRQRIGSGPHSNITWGSWNSFGDYEAELGHRLVINRTNSTGAPYITLKKRELRTDLTSGWYNFAGFEMKQGDGSYDPLTPNEGPVQAGFWASRQWDNNKNRMLLSLRGATDSQTKSEVVLYEDSVNLVVGGKSSRWTGTDWLVDGNKAYHEGFKPALTDLGITGKSIGFSQALPSAVDLNNYKTPGVYHQGANAGAASGSNYPENLAGSLIVYSSAGVTQEYRVYNTSRLWRRSQYSSGAWTAWAKDYNSGDKPTASDIGAVSTSQLLPTGGGIVPWNSLINKIPVVNDVGVTEIGRYLDMRETRADVDFNWRIDAGEAGSNKLSILNGSQAVVAEFKGDGRFITKGAVMTDETGGSGWIGRDNASFRVSKEITFVNGGYAKLISHRAHFSGQYTMDNSLGTYADGEGRQKVCMTLVSTDGNLAYVWKFRNDGNMYGPSNNVFGGDGNIWGTIFGGSQNVTTWATKNFAPISDASLKRNIKPATKSALNDIKAIKFVSYDWEEASPFTKDKKSPEIGVTAQQMEEINPCYAKDIETFKPDGSVETSIKSLDVTNMLALALKAIQEQQDQIEILKSEVSKLKEVINSV